MLESNQFSFNFKVGVMVFNATFNNISFNFNFMTEQYKIKASEWQNWLNILLIQQHFVDLHEGMIHALC